MRNRPKNIDTGTTPRPIEPILSRKKGRRPQAMAGNVEERILDAAAAMFLQYGFGGTSLERNAEAASAGKATLYSRNSGKEGLFSAVVTRTSNAAFVSCLKYRNHRRLRNGWYS